MISKQQIELNLIILENLYNNDNNNAVLYSKLAILELCGWIEETMDKIILDYCQNKTIDLSYTKNVVVKRISSFEFDKFKIMLIHAIGFTGYELLEQHIDQSKHSLFVSRLDTLKTVRNELAHTHTQVSQTRRVDSPSVTKSHLPYIFDGLDQIDTVLCRFDHWNLK